MIIGIDASFLRKQNTGLGQATTNFLKKLVEISNSPPRIDEQSSLRVEAGQLKILNDKETEFILYLEEDTDLVLPKNFRKEIFLPLWKRDDLIRKIWWEKCLLPRHAKKNRCDVLISLYQSTTIRPHTVTEHIMVVHDIIPRLFPEYLSNWRKKIYQRLVERAMNKADKIIAVSHRTEKDLIQHVGIAASKITVSYIDVDEIFKKTVSPQECSRVMKKYNLKPGYIYNGGGLEVRKNTEGVMRAYKSLVDYYAPVMDVPDLVISGKMMPQLAPLITDVEQLVLGLGLKDRIKLLDFVPQEDLPALYVNAAMFVFPSHYEGFGLPVLEAMNMGTPVITSKTSSLPEVGGDSVLYCKPDDIHDMAMVMRNVLKNEKVRQSLAEKGKERAKRFSWERFVEKMLHIIEQQ